MAPDSNKRCFFDISIGGESGEPQCFGLICVTTTGIHRYIFPLLQVRRPTGTAYYFT